MDPFLALSRQGLAPLARAGYFAPGPARRPRRVVLLAGHWLGDTYWASQVVPALRERLGPDAELWVATKARARALWEGLVPASRVLVLPHLVSDRLREGLSLRGLWADARRLRWLEADLLLDLTSNPYSAQVAFLARPSRAYGCDAHRLSWLYSQPSEPHPAGAHLATRPWRALAQAFGEAPPSEVLPRGLAPPLPPARETLAALGLGEEAALAVLAPGAGWASKRWPAERFAALGERLRAEGLEVLALGSAAERALLERVAGRSYPGLSLARTRLLLARARLVVANDSGLGHLAAGEGTPVLSLFNSTNPGLYRPLGPRVRVLRSGCAHEPRGAEVHCHGQAEFPCPASCWDGLDLERAWSACQELLA